MRVTRYAYWYLSVSFIDTKKVLAIYKVQTYRKQTKNSRLPDTYTITFKKYSI